MPSADTILDQLQVRTGQLEIRMDAIESGQERTEDRLDNVLKSVNRILSIAEGASKTLVAIGGVAVFLLTMVGLYQALVK